MTKNLFRIPLWALFSLSLLSSCRSENDLVLSDQSANIISRPLFKTFLQEEENKFIENYRQSNPKVNISKGDYYAYGFKKLYIEYYQKNNVSLNDKDSSIDFSTYSQLIEFENGDKGVAFPVVRNGSVDDIVLGILGDKGTYVRFESLRNDPKYESIKDLFIKRYQRSGIKLTNLNAGINGLINPMADCAPGVPDNHCHDIDPVIVPGKPKPTDPLPPINPYPPIIIPPPSPVPPLPNPTPPYSSNPQGTCWDFRNGECQDEKNRWDNPCDRAKKIGDGVKALYRNEELKREVFDKLNALKGQNNESSRAVGLDANGKYTFSTLKEGTSHNTEMEDPPGDYLFNAHTHTGLGDGGGAPHSGKDLYSTLEHIANSPTFKGSFTIGSNGKTYALMVNNREQVIEFLKKYPRNQNLASNGTGKEIAGDSEFAQEYLKVYNCFMNGPCYGGEDEASQDAAIEAGLSFVTEKFNMGVTFLQEYDNGQFGGFNTTQGNFYSMYRKDNYDGWQRGKCR